MVTINIEYQGDLHCKLVHGPSGAEINSDAPKDNHGRGESFSPTDLVAAALGSCMLTVMGIKARMLGVDINGATATVKKDMANAPVRRVQALTVVIRLPHRLSDEHQRNLEEAAHGCPVKKSLHPDIQMPVEFVWG
jgi:putative redox protein